MNKILKISVFLTLLLICFSEIQAQEKAVTEQQLSTLQLDAYDKLKGRSYRRTMKSESYKNVNDSSPYYFVTSILESAPPDRTHSIYENKTADGTKRTETITIGDKKYQRLNNEGWKDITSENQSFGGGFGTADIKSQITVEFQYVGKKTVNGQDADLYEKKRTTKFESRGKDFTSIYTERFWFDKEGFFLKTESESKNNGKVTSHTIFEYEYDPKIKIEAPTIETNPK